MEDYKGAHEAPTKETGAPLHNLKGVYPEDFHSHLGARYYGDEGGSEMDRKSVSIMQNAKDRPNKEIHIFRAVPHEPSKSERMAEHEKHMAHYMKKGEVPKDSSLSGSAWYNWAHEHKKELESESEKEVKHIKKINAGDWVTINKKYAEEHGKAHLNNKYKIISKKVPARHLYTDANSVHEFGYDPTEEAKKPLKSEK